MAQGKETGKNGNNSNKGDTNKRGFASMDPEKQKEAARKGGESSGGGSHSGGNGRGKERS